MSLIDNKELPTAHAVREDTDIKDDFKVFTKAVCEEKSEHIFCRDKLFVRCNGVEYAIEGNIENFTSCNNIKLNLFDIKATGHVIINKGWIDPRK